MSDKYELKPWTGEHFETQPNAEIGGLVIVQTDPCGRGPLTPAELARSKELTEAMMQTSAGRDLLLSLGEALRALRAEDAARDAEREHEPGT